MANVYCSSMDCANLDVTNMQCTLTSISIDVDDSPACYEFKHYLDTPEYQSPYWIAVEEYYTGVKTRILKHGKEIVKGDYVFYTSDDVRDAHSAKVTEKRTGQTVCRLSELDEYLAKPNFATVIAAAPDVMLLPS